MDKIIQLRSKLYDILALKPDDEHRKSTESIIQQLGVQMSPSSQKEGVKIFQIQNSTINHVIINQIVDILRFLDSSNDREIFSKPKTIWAVV